MRALATLLTLIVVVAAIGLLAEAMTFGGAWWHHRQGRYDDEIRWLESFRPIMSWERSLERLIARRYRERVARALQADRLDRAVHLFRAARANTPGPVAARDPELLELGIETFRRAADRMVKHGRLTDAADYGDSLFVLAIRATEPHHRYAALAAFGAGLDLRTRAGQPCAALARVEWARRGLGGEVPGLAASVEEDLTVQCRQQRGERR